MAPVNNNSPRPPQNNTAAQLPAPSTVAPSTSGSTAANDYSKDSWSFNPVRPQIPGMNGAPRLWAMPGGAGTSSSSASSSAPPPSNLPAPQKPAADPAAAAY